MQVPTDLIKSFQKRLVNKGSQSDTMTYGTPYNLWMVSIRSLATFWAEKGCFREIKHLYFVNQSTTIIIASLLSDLGSCLMKSIDM